MKVVVEMRERDYNTMKKGFLIVGVQDGKPLDSMLDEITAEIEQEYNRLSSTRADETLELGECLGLKLSLKIINKYREGGRE